MRAFSFPGHLLNFYLDSVWLCQSVRRLLRDVLTGIDAATTFGEGAK